MGPQGARLGPRRSDFMAKNSVQRDRRLMHAALRESLERYKHELLSIEERELLHSRIVELKTRLAKSA
jgi:hypothetical protein